MDAGAVFIDISSDEENDIDDSFDLSDEWINKLFDSVEFGVEGAFDDVMVLDELSAPLCTKKPRLLQRESDDECLILDGDPDKLMSVADGKNCSIDGVDELIIVGEKGHLACRDYPHPRHLCLTFPFNSSPHEHHCKLCHCYVCDSPAPCIYWGTGLSATDHCHSSEKEQAWKSLRSSFKQGITTVSKPLLFPNSKQSPIQLIRSYHDIFNRKPGSQRANVSGLTRLSVNQGDLTQLFPNLVRTMSVPTNLSSRNDQSSGFSLHECSVSNQHQRTASQMIQNSDLLGSKRKQASSNMTMIHDMLASIEADLFDTDFDGGCIAGGNVLSVSTATMDG